jgi:hypothetical protein
MRRVMQDFLYDGFVVPARGMATVRGVAASITRAQFEANPRVAKARPGLGPAPRRPETNPDVTEQKRAEAPLRRAAP